MRKNKEDSIKKNENEKIPEKTRANITIERLSKKKMYGKWAGPNIVAQRRKLHASVSYDSL